MPTTPSAQQPHRPGPLHQTNKVHKAGRHARKSSATSEIKTKTAIRPTLKVKREDRLNQADQVRKLKRDKTIQEKRKLGLEQQPPLLIGILDLHLNSCLSLFKDLKDYEDKSAIKVTSVNNRSIYAVSSKLKSRFKFLALDSTNFDETLTIVKSLDLLMLLYKPNTIESDLDQDVAKLLRAIHIHCLPTTIHIIDGERNNAYGARRTINAKRILKSKIGEEKMHCIEKSQDYLQLLHLLANCKRQKSPFKEMRPIIDTDKVEIVGDSLALFGFVRKQTLSPNDLVHMVGFGDYQIKQIDVLPDVVSFRQVPSDQAQIIQTLLPDPMRQETLEQENDIDPMEGEQTWPTAEELAAEAERRNTKKIIKKLPQGTSEYQGAWIPDDSGDESLESSSSSDSEGDKPMKDIVEEEETDSGPESESMESGPEQDEEDEGDSKKVTFMDIDEYDKSHSKDKEMKILEKLKEARLDEMFPDEIDTPSDVAARVRFAKYRGLKSFRTSPWDAQENLPSDYSRIFAFQNFHHTKRRIISERDAKGVSPGLYVRVVLAKVSEEDVKHILARSLPPYAVGLLKFERKMTVMNVLIKRLQDSNLDNPIKSKDELIFYVGFRKFKTKPLFTNHSMSSKFKYERFLRDDVAMVATFYAPITFPPAPVLVFRQTSSGAKDLVASGSVLDSSPSRLVIKRIRLSGHPFKIHSKVAVIRFMFFNSEDVTYFKPVELTSKYNRRGHITEPIGTHGHMKCTFDKKIRSDDCVFMNLYKRVFPKWNYEPIY